MKIEYQIDLPISADRLFELTQDYALRTAWDPLTRATQLDKEQGLVHYTASNGLTMDIRHISYQPGKVAAFEMVSGPPLFDKFAGSWRYQSLGPELTRMHSCYSIQTKPHWLAWLLTPLVAAEFRRKTRQRMASLKRYLERQNASQPHEAI